MYNTPEQKLAFLKKKGNIVTFKKPQWGKKQVIIVKLIQHKEAAMIDGEFGYTSPWFMTLEKLFDAIDWEWMAKAHS
jgi:hypothetical protein